jgi:uncharacterized membrane protein YeaQ/YmgE (transglycosylase-associated protein family)
MDKRILKTALVFFITMVFGLLMPIVGQWYEQQTGLQPFALYFVGITGAIVVLILNIYKIWEELK